jgi:FkbM family methyltransferase
MKEFMGWALPDGEEHLQGWMSHPKNREIINGRQAYQGRKQLEALALCKRFRVAIDVGAHVGFWSYNLAAKFEHVHAFEPVAAHRECFVKNVTAKNVVLIARALGSEKGLVSIHSSPTSSGDSWVDGEGSIPMDLLDTFDIQNVDLIKLDCEGYELNVLRGAEMTLVRSHPAVVVEQKPGRASKFGLPDTGAVKYLQSLGAILRKEISGDFYLSWDD